MRTVSSQIYAIMHQIESRWKMGKVAFDKTLHLCHLSGRSLMYCSNRSISVEHRLWTHTADLCSKILDFGSMIGRNLGRLTKVRCIGWNYWSSFQKLKIFQRDAEESIAGSAINWRIVTHIPPLQHVLIINKSLFHFCMLYIQWQCFPGFKWVAHKRTVSGSVPTLLNDWILGRVVEQDFQWPQCF